ncbi:hypothetical protein GCM10023319_17060 [Nocardia iowensis]
MPATGFTEQCGAGCACAGAALSTVDAPIRVAADTPTTILFMTEFMTTSNRVGLRRPDPLTGSTL